MDRKVLNEVLESLPTGVMLADETGTVIYANKTAQQYLGIDGDGLRGVNIRDTVLQGSGRKDLLVTTKGDQSIMVKLTRMPLSNGSTAVVLADVTETHRLQQELLKMDRLASVGELTSGIAHEIRNPLAGIKTTAQALKAEIPENDHRNDYVSRIILEIDRLNKLLMSFFDFAKPRDLKVRDCDLKRVIEDSVFSVQDTARQGHVRIVEFYPNGGLSVKADPDLLHQVLMNIFINALQAMPAGGKMEVHLAEDGNNARIEVKDSGKGIPEDIRGRIFDPFFTTKPKGIGLGLSISYRLIKMHSGSIAFASSPAGTTFTISLPRGVKR